MSLRYLYRKYAPEERICPGCRKPIIRNIAVHEGELWHYGCLQEAKQWKYRCLNCHRVLRKLDVAESQVMGVPLLSCRFCGSTGVQPLYSWSPPVIEVVA